MKTTKLSENVFDALSLVGWHAGSISQLKSHMHKTHSAIEVRYRQTKFIQFNYHSTLDLLDYGKCSEYLTMTELGVLFAVHRPNKYRRFGSNQFFTSLKKLG
jgi:hypothetical protein